MHAKIFSFSNRNDILFDRVSQGHHKTEQEKNNDKISFEFFPLDYLTKRKVITIDSRSNDVEHIFEK